MKIGRMKESEVRERDASKRAGSVPLPSGKPDGAPMRRASSASAADRARDEKSEEEALTILMEASSAEKKKRAAAKPEAVVDP